MATMAERMGIKELRDSLTASIRRVRAGETIEVTHHGVPVAVLAPVPGDRIGRLVAAGDVTPGRPLDGPLRRHPVVGTQTASAAIEADRGER